MNAQTGGVVGLAEKSSEFEFDKASAKIRKEAENGHHLLTEHLVEVAGTLGNSNSEVPLTLRLAATDVFVEKAQHHLTRRGVASYIFAFIFLLLTATIAVGFIYYITVISPESENSGIYNELNGYSFSLILVQKLVVGSTFFAGIYLSASFARAFMHEGTILFSRRHALRFGRLFVYLSDGKMTSKELFDAFGWNITPSTAFTKIKPEYVTKGLVSQLSDALEKTAKAASAGFKRDGGS